ncbi:MAG TPA: Hsp70 family protein [Candidatus Cloacimonadota bacterium]|nr:Hsp70 family protein [Candidatus Cloacimonadota bacterium]HPK39980.1 Hsp70 family protein [Candidatus Cloacimonadota bacterium]
MLPKFVFQGHPFDVSLKTNKGYTSYLEHISCSSPEKILKDFSGTHQKITNNFSIISGIKLESLGNIGVYFKFRQETIRHDIKSIDFKNISLSVGSFQELRYIPGSKELCVLLSSYWHENDFKFRFSDNMINDMVDLNIVDGDNFYWFNKKKTDGQNDYEFTLSHNDFEILYQSLENTDEKEIKVSLRIKFQQFFDYDIPLLIQFRNIPHIILGNDEYLKNTQLYENDDKNIDFVFKLKDSSKNTDIGKVEIRSETKGVQVRQRKYFFDEHDTINTVFNVKYSDLDQTRIRKDGANTFLLIQYSLSFIINEKVFNMNNSFSFLIADAHKVVEIRTLALDFGTTNTCYAYTTDDGLHTSSYLDVLDDTFADAIDDEHVEIPTTLVFRKFMDQLLNHHVFITDYHFGDKSAKTFAFMFKSLLPYNTERTYYDLKNNVRIMSPFEITKLYMKFVLDRLKKRRLIKPKELIMSYPANFERNTIDSLLNVTKELGYSVDETMSISEPEAIALYYIDNKYIKVAEEPVYIAIYDCGGGTTDIAIVKLEDFDGDYHIEVLATYATDLFCGNYMNWFLASQSDDSDKFPDTFVETLKDDFTNEKVKYFYEQFVYFEEIKKGITKKFEKNINEKNIEKRLMASIDSDKNETFRKLEIKITNNLETVTTLMQKLWEANKVKSIMPDYLILAGNSTRLPFFKYIADKVFQKPEIISDSKRKISVAEGMLAYKKLINTDTKIKGLSLSNKSYYIITKSSKFECIFPLWLDMNTENVFSYTASRPSSYDFTVYQVDDEFIPLEEMKIKDLKSAFTIPIERRKNKVKETLNLKYYQFTVSYQWEIELDNGEKYETTYKEIV